MKKGDENYTHNIMIGNLRGIYYYWQVVGLTEVANENVRLISYQVDGIAECLHFCLASKISLLCEGGCGDEEEEKKKIDNYWYYY